MSVPQTPQIWGMIGINRRQLITYSYHVYEIATLLDEVGGPIKPWFGQPGLNAQLNVVGKGEILALLDMGYLRRVKKLIIHAGWGVTCEQLYSEGERRERG